MEVLQQENKEIANVPKEQATMVDIKKVKGPKYLELLLGDEEKLGVTFEKEEAPQYNFGTEYEFDTFEKDVFPTFDYEKLDKKLVIDYKNEQAMFDEFIEENQDCLLSQFSDDENENFLDLHDASSETSDLSDDSMESREGSLLATEVATLSEEFEFDYDIDDHDFHQPLNHSNSSRFSSPEEVSQQIENLQARNSRKKKKGVTRWIFVVGRKLNVFRWFIRSKKKKAVEDNGLYTRGEDLTGVSDRDIQAARGSFEHGLGHYFHPEN